MKIKPVQGIFEPFLPSYSRRLGNTIFKPSPDQEGWVRARTDKGYIFPQFKDGLTANLFADHVNDNICLGFRAAESVNLFVLDFDNHGGGPARQREINEQFFKSLVYFERSAIGFRSSDSGGIHLYVFLNDFIRLEDMRPVIKHYLNILNLPENTEIFPDAGRGLRLPFGKGNRPLPDGIDSLINCSKTDRQNWFLNWFYNDCEPLNVNQLHSIRQQIAEYEPVKPKAGPKAKKQDQTTAREFDPATDAKDSKIVRRLITEGLRPGDDRNDALLKLAYHYIKKLDYPKAQAQNKLFAWIDNRHNGNSDTYNRDRQEVYRHIRNIIRYFDKSKTSKNKGRFIITGDEFLFMRTVRHNALLYGDPAGNGTYSIRLGWKLLRGSKNLKTWRNNRISDQIKQARYNKKLITKDKYTVADKTEGIEGQAREYIVCREWMEMDESNYTILFRDKWEFNRFVDALGGKIAARLLDSTPVKISKIKTGSQPIPVDWRYDNNFTNL